MNWQLPQDLEVDELIYLQDKVYPKLKESFVYLVQYLMESGEHLDQYKTQRKQVYDKLLKEKEEIIKKRKQESGDDYNQSSDEETIKVEQKIKNFEKFHKNDIQQIKTERNQQDTERERSESRAQTLNEYIKQQQKQYEEDQIIEKENKNEINNDKQSIGSDDSSKNKFKKMDHFSEVSSDNGTEDDEYLRRDSYQRNKSFHVFNPLRFLAQDIKRRNQFN